MESFEFLGGRYNRPEQIMAGPVQAFRAQNAANGRTVFIHRVSTTEAPEEQAALLKLLTTALVKSADAKRMVLDFGEESGFWYVVTENEPQCALLREWLQIEIDAAAGIAAKPAPPPVAQTPRKSSSEEPDPGEFTRFLKGRAPLTSSPVAPPPVAPPPVAPPPPKAEPNVGEFTRVFGAQRDSQPPPIAPPPGGKPNKPIKPGEFTDFFNATDEERKQIKQSSSSTPQPPPFAQPPANSPSQAKPPASEPGEFTRFFKPGLPPMPSKPGPKVPQTLNFERTQQDNPNVQRPNTAQVNFPALGAKPPEKGEFTQLFSRPDNAKAPAKPPAANYQAAPPVRSDPLGFAKQPSGQPNDLSDELFNDKINIPTPTPSSQPQQSEFTRMFGSAGASSPPVQKQSVIAPPREKSLLEEPDAKNTQPLAVPNLSSAPPEAKEQPGNSPSEFTRIMQGGYGPAKSAGGPPATPAAGGAAPHAGGSGSPLLNVHVSPINPASALPHLGSAGGSVGSAHASASAHGASVGTPLGSASAYGPHVPQMHVPPPTFGVPAPSAKSGNKKLIIFFVVIGVLAVLLVLLMLFVMKNK